mmetsp:Transcript_22392/g.49037  ORF Transcript_22392/g.49037 Transcript_22392/m.49037 type:complete len:142 (-) Transcript_22392:60-485(-)
MVVKCWCHQPKVLLLLLLLLLLSSPLGMPKLLQWQQHHHLEAWPPLSRLLCWHLEQNQQKGHRQVAADCCYCLGGKEDQPCWCQLRFLDLSPQMCWHLHWLLEALSRSVEMLDLLIPHQSSKKGLEWGRRTEEEAKPVFVP